MNFNTFLQSIQVLLEAAYDSKVIAMKKKYPEQSSLIDSVVVKLQKKQDRIFWFLRILEEFETNKKLSDATLGSYNFESLEKLLTDIEHFYGYPYPPIQQLIYNKQSIGELIGELEKLEEKYNSKLNNEKGAVVKRGDRVLFDFGSTKWWILNRAYCSDEGRSGHHCGNVVGKNRTNQRILSLRNNANQVILTFILEPDIDSNKLNMKIPSGYLGEMKAKGNNKPQESYHPQIMKLLLSPVVKGIRGEGFLPHMNFSIFDLSEKDLKIIDEKKPSLIEDQIKITPIEVLNAPNWLKEKYRKYITNISYDIGTLLDDGSLENWKEAIKSNKKLLINLPEEYWNEYPDFVNQVADILAKDEKLFYKAPKKLTRDIVILKKLIEKNPTMIRSILPTNKFYKELAQYALSKNLNISYYIEDLDIIAEHLGVNVDDIIKDNPVINKINNKLLNKILIGNLTINAKISSLKNMPKMVIGNVYCDGIGLKTLKGSPENVLGFFSCNHNYITTLEGCPKTIGDTFDCSFNQLTTLEGGPEHLEGGSFNCSNNQLTTLEGAPESIKASFYCNFNRLTTLAGAPKHVGGWFDCSSNQLTTLEGAPESVDGRFICTFQENKVFTEKDVENVSNVTGQIIVK